ncbi:MAG: DUF2007 domain-containing protein [Alphaproteobacteria bacterium]|nr:DUF2007 domain-containing protein [Alphaproteobacteria bacterium]
MKVVSTIDSNFSAHAELIKTYLEERGVAAVVRGYHLSGIRLDYLSGGSPVEVLVVHDSDYERAKEYIKDFFEGNEEPSYLIDGRVGECRRPFLMRFGRFLIWLYILFILLGMGSMVALIFKEIGEFFYGTSISTR